jgi:hypothetical protein
MANNFINAPDVPGIYHIQDYWMEKLDFITSAKKKLDIKKLVAEFSYYEDIYTFAVSGYITLTDAQGYAELLQLTGNEYLEVDFGKIKGAKNNLRKKFRVYKLANRTPSGNMNAEFYTLYFCSEELLLSEQTKISKSYKGKKISENIEDILMEKLKVSKNDINVIEETTGVNDFIVPKVKPFEAISWLSNYAKPKATPTVGADMLFFETKNGFNFRSLQSMYKSKPYATYTYEAKNIDDNQQSMQEKATTVIKYEIVKSHDMLDEINSGTFANRLISIDPLTRSYNVTDFDYTKYRKQSTALNSNAAASESKNRLGKTQSQSSESVLKLVVGNSKQQDSTYVKEQSKDGKGISKDVFIENFVPNRTAQIALANYSIIKLSIPGDPGITAGRTIEFNIYSLGTKDSQRQLDKFNSGKYLVTAVRHLAVSPNVYQTILEISKDSSPANYASTDNSSAEAKQNSGFTAAMNNMVKK